MILNNNELTNLDKLIIENEINYFVVERLKALLAEESDNKIILIFRNIISGSFSYAFQIGEMLSHAIRKVIIVCDKKINLSGIIPVISASSVITAATDNTSFVINAHDYIRDYCGTEDKKIALPFFKELFFENTNFHEIELAYLLNSKTTLDVDSAYKYGIITDIYRSNMNTKIESNHSLARLDNDADITLERRERDFQKMHNQGFYIKFSLN